MYNSSVQSEFGAKRKEGSQCTENFDCGFMGLAFAKPLYFMVACPRSGTYLLSAILNQSGRIGFPTETHFIPLFPPYLWLAGALEHPAARRRAMRAIFVFLRIWLARAEEERDFAAMKRHSLLSLEGESEQIADAACNYAELVRRLFAAYALAQGAEMAGDKSAFFDHIPLERMDSAVSGQARFIHIIRDGRDVCLSWLGTKVGPRTLAQAAQAWAQHVTGKRAWGALHPDRYHELRYEDLLTEPEKTLRGVCGFAGIPYSDALLGFHATSYARDIANSTTHARLSQPLDPGNLGKWRRGMTADEMTLFETIAGSVLADCGYPLTGSGLVTTWPSERSTKILSIHRLRLTLKGLLPACALIAVRLHLPLDRLCNSRLWLRVESWLAGRNRRRYPPHSP